jgi:hypothetical protein
MITQIFVYISLGGMVGLAVFIGVGAAIAAMWVIDMGRTLDDK